MSHIITLPRMMTAFAALLLPVGALATMTTVSSAKLLDAPQICEIGVKSAGGTVRLDALVNADKAVAGSYTFRVEKTGGGGSSTINQGGDFDAKAGETATLSSVSLGGKGAAFKATLIVNAGGKSVTCTKQAGGI